MFTTTDYGREPENKSQTSYILKFWVTTLNILKFWVTTFEYKENLSNYPEVLKKIGNGISYLLGTGLDVIRMKVKWMFLGPLQWVLFNTKGLMLWGDFEEGAVLLICRF